MSYHSRKIFWTFKSQATSSGNCQKHLRQKHKLSVAESLDYQIERITLEDSSDDDVDEKEPDDMIEVKEICKKIKI